MKRMIALVLILVLATAMSVTAFATEATDGDTGNSHEVLASYEAGTENKTVISVDISWQQMTFTYKGPSEPVWNAEQQRYEGEETEGGWEEGTGTITISNNSNAILQADIDYNQETGYRDVSMAFTDQAPFIGSADTADRQDADGTVRGTPCVVTVKAIPTGTLPKETEDNTRVGTITITLTEVTAVDEMLDLLSDKAGTWNVFYETGLGRGTAYMTSIAERTRISSLIDEAVDVYYNETSEQEKNVAINQALTAFYGALELAP